MKINVGDIFEHRFAIERVVRVLEVDQTLTNFSNEEQAGFVKVEYLSTTNEQNRGLIAFISEHYIENFYLLGGKIMHDWEV